MLIRQAKIGYLKSSLLSAKASPQMAAEMWYRIICRTPPSIDDSMSLDIINEFFKSAAELAVTDDH